jgi:DNA ligase 1
MNSAEIFDQIERIAATSSKLEKQELVKQGMAFDLFRWVMTATYNPLVTYGVAAKTLESTKRAFPFGGAPFTPATMELVEALAYRKITGTEAEQALIAEFGRLDEKSDQLLRRILLKDMRAGFSESTINKASPGFIPEFPYMRCSLPDKSNMDKWDWTRGVFSQQKADGMFANLDYYDTGEVAIRSRQGTPFPMDEFVHVQDFVQKYFTPGHEYHGELVVHKISTDEALPREISNGIMNSIVLGGKLEDDQKIVYHVWDRIPLEFVKPGGKYDVTYRFRLKSLLNELYPSGVSQSVRLIPTQLVFSKAQAYADYGTYLRQGKEGTICKYSDAIWKDTTSKDQVKLKLEVDVDLVAKAIVPGRLGTKNEGRPGSITCETLDGLLRVDVTVKNEAMRDAIEANPDAFLEKIYAVRSNLVLNPSESNPLHSLFLPRFVEAAPRIDKTTADTLEQVQDQFRNAIEAV